MKRIISFEEFQERLKEHNGEASMSSLIPNIKLKYKKEKAWIVNMRKSSHINIPSGKKGERTIFTSRHFLFIKGKHIYVLDN